MNERIRELVLEAGFVHYGEDMGFYNIPVPAFNGRMEKFAELIVRECVDVASKYDAPKMSGPGLMIGHMIEQHFGVEE